MESTSALGRTSAEAEPSRCPIDRAATSGVCPFPHAATSGASAPPVQRSAADVMVRRLLRIPDRPSNLSQAAAYSAFQRSMAISAARCTLTYVVFPFVLPAFGVLTGVGPVVGILIGVVAITCDVFAIRRFFAVDHRWRWHFSAIALAVIVLLAVLLVQDVIHLAT